MLQTAKYVPLPGTSFVTLAPFDRIVGRPSKQPISKIVNASHQVRQQAISQPHVQNAARGFLLPSITSTSCNWTVGMAPREKRVLAINLKGINSVVPPGLGVSVTPVLLKRFPRAPPQTIVAYRFDIIVKFDDDVCLFFPSYQETELVSAWHFCGITDSYLLYAEPNLFLNQLILSLGP